MLRATTACTFSILNFQKWSENGVFSTFWLANVLRATTACDCSSLVWPAGSAPAALASLLFDPPGSHKSLKKHSELRLSYLFAHLHLLCSYSFSSTLLPSDLSLLSASALLCFSSVHIDGSLTFKLPSVIHCACQLPSTPGRLACIRTASWKLLDCKRMKFDGSKRMKKSCHQHDYKCLLKL